jgi:hypothetical protein
VANDMEYLIIILLFLFVGYREWIHNMIHRDLLDRLMSRDFEHYKDNTALPEEPEEPEETNVLELDDPDAREEIINGQREED